MNPQTEPSAYQTTPENYNEDYYETDDLSSSNSESK